jgi:predicted ATPase/DNA-binding CsgD family transcriptional regulator
MAGTVERSGTAVARGGALPAEFTRFVGRRRELAEVKRLLSGGRLVTLTGIGGVGKTRLALRAAADLSRAFRDGVHLVELAELRDPALLRHTVAGALGLREQASDGQTSSLVEYLAPRQVLLVLDNCEHLIDGCAALAGEPQLRILATSGQSLGVSGENVVLVPSLAMPDPDGPPPTPQALEQYEAVTLFVERATAAVPTFAVTEQNCAAVAALCRGLDGIPLALELAAVRLRALSPAEILGRLSSRYGLLTRGDPTAPARQQTLRASMNWSWELCSAQERTLWARLAVFTGGFELDSVEGVCSDEHLPPAAVLDVVASLVDRSVLGREEYGSHVRYRMLETIRQYGEEKLEEQGELHTWRRRHRDWYAELAARAEGDWISPRQLEWGARLRREHPNLRAALEFSVADPGEAAASMRIASALEQHWVAWGRMSEGRHWLDRALAHPTAIPVERARALRLDAWLALLQSDTNEAARMLDEARPLAEAAGDDVARAYVLQTSGMLAMFQGDLSSAVDLLDQAMAVFRSAGHVMGQIHTAFLLGMNLGLAGALERAIEAHRECLALAEPLGEFWFRSYSLWALGLDAWRTGDQPRAAALEKDSLRMKRDLDDQVGIALCLEALAWLATTEHDAERSPTLLGAADAIWQVVGMSLTEIPFFATYRAEGEAAARQRLPERAFEAAFRRGAQLTATDAIALALEEVVPARAKPATSEESTGLTRRELEIAELVAQGMSNKAIAGRLVISTRTVETHVDHILTKLAFTSRSQIAAWMGERTAERREERRHLRSVSGEE